MSFKSLLAAAALKFGLLVGGCGKPIFFPTESMVEEARRMQAFGAYDTDRDGKADFFTFADASGRINRVAYATGGDGNALATVDLDAIPPHRCRHLVIILDGFGYEVVKKFRDEGGLRFFHAPSRVVAPYPTMTDLGLEDALGYMPCRAFEAMYYDRRQGKIVGGSLAYLCGKSQPYNRLLQYRAGMIWDAIQYVHPWPVFGKEMGDVKRKFDQAKTQELLAYIVSSAGVGTQRGAEGQRQCLRVVDQLVHQVIWETRGLVKVTLFADHGHSYTPAKRIPLEDHLGRKGWRIVDSLRRPKDVAYIRFGLETYASFATNQPAELAADLIAAEGVELASYAEKDAAVVLGRDGGRAVIRHKTGRHKYEPTAGDPLKLKDILAALPADAEGYCEDDAVLAATVSHEYPAPLERLWRAHFGMVENPPDVIISLEDRFFSGLASFGGTVNVASTHGGFNYRNSTTFIMSTAGALPPFMRSADIPGNMGKILGVPFPMRK